MDQTRVPGRTRPSRGARSKLTRARSRSVPRTGQLQGAYKARECRLTRSAPCRSLTGLRRCDARFPAAGRSDLGQGALGRAGRGEQRIIDMHSTWRLSAENEQECAKGARGRQRRPRAAGSGRARSPGARGSRGSTSPLPAAIISPPEAPLPFGLTLPGHYPHLLTSISALNRPTLGSFRRDRAGVGALSSPRLAPPRPSRRDHWR
jgi:hypothetical protein